MQIGGSFAIALIFPNSDFYSLENCNDTVSRLLIFWSLILVFFLFLREISNGPAMACFSCLWIRVRKQNLGNNVYSFPNDLPFPCSMLAETFRNCYKEKIQRVQLSQTGSMLTAGRKWLQPGPINILRFKSCIRLTVNMEWPPFKHFRRDKFETAKETCWLKLHLYTPSRTVPETDQSSTIRYLAEMVWFPSAALENTFNGECRILILQSCHASEQSKCRRHFFIWYYRNKFFLRLKLCVLVNSMEKIF